MVWVLPPIVLHYTRIVVDALIVSVCSQSLHETIGAKDRAFMAAHAEQEALRAKLERRVDAEADLALRLEQAELRAAAAAEAKLRASATVRRTVRVQCATQQWRWAGHGGAPIACHLLRICVQRLSLGAPCN